MMSDVDYTARRIARSADERAQTSARDIENLQAAFREAQKTLAQALLRIEALEKELAPKTLDKKPNPLPLEKPH